MRATADHKRQEAGFTIIELMIVVTLIALASALVVLAWPNGRAKLDGDASRFAARARAAHDLALIEGRSVSVWVSSGGYGFDRHDKDGWQPIAEKPFRVTRWDVGVRPVFASEDGRARVIFDTTGFANVPLNLDLVRDGVHSRVSIGSDGTVRIDG